MQKPTNKLTVQGVIKSDAKFSKTTVKSVVKFVLVALSEIWHMELLIPILQTGKVRYLEPSLFVFKNVYFFLSYKLRVPSRYLSMSKVKKKNLSISWYGLMHIFKNWISLRLFFF